MRLGNKNLVLLFVIVFYCGCAEKQLPSKSVLVKTEFKNTGEQEDYWAEQLFNRHDKVQQYKKYKSPIVFNGSHYQFKDFVITVDGASELSEIIDNGIFYPDILAKSFIYQPKMKITINQDSIIAWRKRDTSKNKFIIPKTDSVWIGNLKELKFLETTPTKKRFSFWLSRRWLSNPTVYFMELTNKKATTETGLSSFIAGSKLTCFQQGWVIM